MRFRRYLYPNPRMEALLDMTLGECKESSSDSMESINEASDAKRPIPMLKRLNEFRMMAVGCDVTFLVGEKQRPVFGHKLILACSSEVFKAMFYGLLSEFPHSFPDRPRSFDDNDSHSVSSRTSSADESFGQPDEEEEEADAEAEAAEEGAEPAADAHDRPVATVPVLPPTQTRYVATDMSMLTDRRYPPPVETVNVPDINPPAFRKMIDFIYNDFDAKSVHLTDNNVMEVLYAAKKYAIDALVDECVRYLLNDLSPCNAVFLLSQARLFHEETLISRCFEVIDRNTDVALQAQNIDDVDRDTMLTVLGRTQLDPSSELVVFNAAKAWAEAECARQKIAPTSANIRHVLGPALGQIRFPLMDVNEFGMVATTDILTCEEVAEVFVHLTVKPRPNCRYPNGFRCSNRSKHVVSRFAAVSSKRCSKRENKVSFSVDRDIFVYGLGIYGMHSIKPHSDDENTWRCQVEIQLAVVSDPSSYAPPLGVLASNTVFMQGFVGDDQPLMVQFQEPIAVSANQSYVASMRFLSETAVHTVSGRDGRDAVTVVLPHDQQVTFKFNGYRSSYGDDSFKSEGQIPSIYFYVQWPDKSAVTSIE